MRVGVLWSAAVLALLAVSAALRTPQVEGVTRISRRLEDSSDPELSSSTAKASDIVSNYRTRYSRRQETSRDDTPTRARSRLKITEQAQPERIGGNERFDSRRTRTRNRPETQPEPTKESFKNTAIRSRSRTRRPSIPTPEVSQPVDAKIEANTNIEYISKTTTKHNNRGTSQFRRRSSTEPTETVTLKRERGRIITRPKLIAEDLDSSGSTNTILITDKAPTTARTSADLRDARKLRYKLRPIETDSNVTEERIISLNEVKSSQIENATSQSGTQTVAPIFVERIAQQSTETSKPSTTLKVTRVVRRPVTRGKTTPVVPKKQSIDDINEDDNYPESFKALIQAKNATQVNSSVKESLSETASHKVVNIYSTSSSSQPTQTDSADNSHVRLRNKQNANESTKSLNSQELTTKTPEIKSRYKQRRKYSVKNKKSTTFRPDITTTSGVTQNTEKSANKYKRKFQFSTTTPVSRTANNNIRKDTETDSEIKKPASRPSFHSRKFVKTFTTSTEVSVTVSEKKEENIVRKKNSLPRTAYYSRLRNKTETSMTTAASREYSQKKTEDLNDMPLIFTLLNNSENKELMSDSLKKEENDVNKEPFIIAISSTESQENMVQNELESNKAEANNTSSTPPSVATIQEMEKLKYHANYKNSNQIVVEENTQASSTVLPVRNLQRRRQRTRQKEKIDDSPKTTTARSRDRNVRKFSEAFSKTTEASNNGIIAGADKAKTKFSSKYRASYLDKPFYKPTVPSITSSTAWLKFFVTDHLLTRSVEEPNWFRDQVDETTESAANVTTPYIHSSHPSSIELVEGEEMQLGPDNAISITQTRRTLSSADLRLSESLLKSSQVMNVEASQHSPSVTVSIFDALAEILTSTPKPRLSSTTEVTTKPNLNNDVTKILNGVSNIVNVNSAGGITSPDIFVTANASTITQSVQNTDEITPLVINNNMSSGESVTRRLNTELFTSVNTFPTPVPIPTTPLSARRPFAIKVLYSDTESPTDKTSTASDHTSNQPTTDNPKMVYNTVSDLLLSNNNLVSVGLTSMLSNNIKSIIETMDEDSRSRISVDMAKLLKNLIPRAIDGLATRLEKADLIPMTTPYSLKDIRDTENIDIDTDLDSFDILQSVTTDNNVISSEGDLVTSSVTVSDNPTPFVNNLVPKQGVTQSSFLESDSQTMSELLPNSVLTNSRSDFEQITSTSTIASLLPTSIERVTSSDLNDSAIDIVNSDITSTSATTNNSVPLPFLSNFQVKDFTPSDTEVMNMTKSMNQVAETPLTNLEPSDFSPLQLWVLSKKANVLRMIEDIIRQHNKELVTAPTFEETVIPSKNNIDLSIRLSEIMNNMAFTTEKMTMMTNTDNKLSTSTSSLNPYLPSTTIQITPTESSTASVPADDSSNTNTFGFQAQQDGLQTTTEMLAEFSLRFGTNTQSSTSLSATENPTRNTLIATTDIDADQDSNVLGSSSTAGSIPTTTLQENTETTTAFANTETTTQLNIEITTQISDNSRTRIDSETTTMDTNGSIAPAVGLSAATPTIPKKDYVIFGILPNNTVVRKDPNDDPLETLTEASPYIVYGLLPNNTVIRKFPNGTRVPRIMQKIDILPISPWSLRNPYSPIHNIPAIVRPQSNPIRVSTNTVTSTDITNNGTDTISSSALNIKSSSLGITTVTNKPAEISTASHVLSLRTTTMLPSIDEILLNSISSAAKQEMVISSMTSSTREPTILTLDIDPETKQIRTERPEDGVGNTVFKFIPIDEVMVKQQNSNVLKLATKAPSSTNTESSEVQIETATRSTEVNTQSSQTQASTESGTTFTQETSIVTNIPLPTTTDSITFSLTTEAIPVTLTTIQVPTTTQVPPTILDATTQTQTTTQAPSTTALAQTTTTHAPTTTEAITTQTLTTTTNPTTTSQSPRTTFQTTTIDDSVEIFQPKQSPQNSRDPKYLSVQSFNNMLTGAESSTTTRIAPTTQQNDPTALLQALLSATGSANGGLSGLNKNGNNRNINRVPTTTSRSLEEDIRQFEEDTKLLKALLAATGQNPANINVPSLDTVLSTTKLTTTQPQTTTTRPRTTTVMPTTTQASTTPSFKDDIKQFQEDAKLLQALLQATGQNTGNINLPDISKVTSNVRIASNPLTTQIGSKPTTPVNSRPVQITTNGPVFRTFASTTFPTATEASTTEDVKISTTFTPFIQRSTTSRDVEAGTISVRQAPARVSVTTETPSSSTFSVEEDLVFLNNLKQVLNTNTGNEDPETALANRIISLAVDRSLNEIQTGNAISGVRTGKTIANGANNLVLTTPKTTTTITPRTTTTQVTTTQATTQRAIIPSITGGASLDEDIKQFQEDTKLLQALLKATGQDPSKFNIPTLPNITPTVSSHKDDFKISPITLPSRHRDATSKPTSTMKSTLITNKPLPFGAKIAVKDDLRTVQDERKLLKTLIKLQDAQDTTTFRSKLVGTSQTSDQALKKLIQQQKATGMVSEATKSPISLSTEYGKSNDALLAALLKEQGFGPTTASSIDEQVRLAALLNQVVVTPKARRPTTPPPPPPPPRRPVLDGLAWLWQQWRETGPGPAPTRASQRPGPAPSVRPSEATSNRVNWFGSGPFIGNADDRPASSNRIPLEPPRAVVAEQTPGRGQLVSAAINMTRAFSQFLGAAIQGAAQTVQSVIRAGQRAATDVYSNGSGGSG